MTRRMATTLALALAALTSGACKNSGYDKGKESAAAPGGSASAVGRDNAATSAGGMPAATNGADPGVNTDSTLSAPGRANQGRSSGASASAKRP